MSNLRINIRFLQYHFKITDYWKVSITYNDCHKNLEHGWFDIYEFRPFKQIT
jgi:hypothetical protein